MYQSEGLQALTSSSSSLSHWSVSRGYIQNVSINGMNATYTYVLFIDMADYRIRDIYFPLHNH